MDATLWNSYDGERQGSASKGVPASGNQQSSGAFQKSLYGQPYARQWGQTSWPTHRQNFNARNVHFLSARNRKILN
jgi:hypothetical protein